MDVYGSVVARASECAVVAGAVRADPAVTKLEAVLRRRTLSYKSRRMPLKLRLSAAALGQNSRCNASSINNRKKRSGRGE
jgi:hypothetical protein